MSFSVTLKDEEAEPRCLIQGVLDFTTAREALSSVLPHIANNDTLHIDLAGVTDANSAGLALLVEWRAEALRTNHDVTFHHIPDSLRQLAVVSQVDGLI